MLMQIKSAALAAGCIRIRYHGKYQYAVAVLVVTTPEAPVLSLGVSDTDLAAAVTAKQTVFTGDGTMNMRDLIAKINNWIDTTAAREVLEGDFTAELYNAIYTDVVGNATASPYAADAGTLNLKNTWQSALLKDDDAENTSFTSLMIPPPSMSKGAIALIEISGHAGTSGTPTVTRTIYDMDGNILWSSGSIATATSALLLKTFAEPVVFDGPVVVRDTIAAYAHNTATTMMVTYGFPQAKNF